MFAFSGWLNGIAEQGDRGVVSFISNYSWTSEASFVVLREHLHKNFDKFWIDNMHGNRKISEYAPDGRTSETVFAQRGFSPGIQQGVVISLWVKSGKTKPKPVWEFTIGGYQVMKKWLSYREQSLLGRMLTLNELKEVSVLARRLTALVLLQPELNKNYLSIASDTYPYSSSGSTSEDAVKQPVTH